MKHMSSKELRLCRNTFRLSKSHVYLPEHSLVWGTESTAMFTIAGMQQLIPYLSGKEHPLGTRLFNIQKCIRTVDIDEVGDSSHCTFFEMMGNRSLGDYFKKEAVQRSWEFLIDILGFDPKKLAVTVFEWDKDAPKDNETAWYWKSIGISEDKIAYMPASNNRRSPGLIWPCGPDTEIFYWVGTTQFPPEGSNPKTDESHRLEIWNNVFMEFYRDDKGQLIKLKNKNVDTWMGFERMSKVLQEKETVFDTDIFAPIIALIEKVLDVSYIWHERRCRIIADHSRTAFFLIFNDIVPSNEWRWYVLRRLIRRMYYNFMLLNPVSKHIFDDFINNVVKLIDDMMGVHTDIKVISAILIKETHQFQKTISHGQKMLDELIKWSATKNILGKDLFTLYDTFGFPLELTKEILEEQGLNVDMVWFEQEMVAQQERSRAWSKDMFKQGIDWSTYLQWLPPTLFVWYENMATDTMKLLKDFEVWWQRILIFDCTPFYAESGGQIWDKWIVILDDWSQLNVVHVQKYNWIFLHFVS